MAVDFKILRGNKENLIDENGNSKLPEEKLVNGYWYLTNDTAEVYVCLEIDGQLTLKKINECNVSTDLPDFDSFERRLEAIEAEEKIHTYGYRTGFPSVGVYGHMYAAVDEQKTYVWFNNEYVLVGDVSADSEGPDVIFGGTAD